MNTDKHRSSTRAGDGILPWSSIAIINARRRHNELWNARIATTTKHKQIISDAHVLFLFGCFCLLLSVFICVHLWLKLFSLLRAQPREAIA